MSRKPTSGERPIGDRPGAPSSSERRETSRLFDMLDKAERTIEKISEHDTLDPEKLRKPITW